MHFVVEFLLEDDVAVVVHHQETREEVVFVDDYKEVALALGDDVGVGAQGAMHGDGEDVGVDGAVPGEFAERVFVFVVGAEVVLLGEGLGIDGVFLERADAEVGAGGGDHQRNEQCVACGGFGDEEHRRERGLHHAGHHAGHACENEVDVGEVHMEEDLHHVRDQESDKRADEEGRGEDAAHAAGRGGERGGEDLHQDDADDGQHQQPFVAHQLQQRGVVENGNPLAMQQVVDVVIAFAVECGEEVDEQAEGQ